MRLRLAAASLAAAALISGCGSHPVEEVETTAAATVGVTKVAPQAIEGIVSAAGSVAAAPGADWTITAPDAARIIELPKAEGDPVKTGDLLVRFEIPSIHTDLATRRAELEQAQARMENAQASVTRLIDARRAWSRGTKGAGGRAARARRGHAPHAVRREGASQSAAVSSRGRSSALAFRASSRSVATTRATWSRRPPPMSSCASWIRRGSRSSPRWRSRTSSASRPGTPPASSCQAVMTPRLERS